MNNLCILLLDHCKLLLDHYKLTIEFVELLTLGGINSFSNSPHPGKSEHTLIVPTVQTLNLASNSSLLQTITKSLCHQMTI